MSVFANSDFLEEIVETTEEHEAELCSGGETVDECSGLPIGGDFVDEQPEQKPTLPGLSSGSGPGVGSAGAGRQHKSSSGASSRSSSGGSVSALSNGPRAGSRSHMEQEKRMRREIANSNERRRMQSINAGFQSLRTLLPHHEGEKLSKAAILQQTAEYIYQLEQQKTQLLSQNLQLKRLVDQHEGGDVPTKKRKGESQGFARRGARMEARKIDCASKSGELIEEKAGMVVSLPVHVSESGDEGLGSMSPEPLSVITVSADGHASVGPTGAAAAAAAANAELVELKRQLERERVARTHLEKQMRTLQATTALLPDRYRDDQLIAYQPHEVIEHTNNVLPQELEDGLPGLQVVSVVSVPQVGSTQTVETSNADSNTPPLSPQPGCEVVVPGSGDEQQLVKDVGELLAIESRPSSPKLVGFAGVTVFASSLEAADQISAAAAVVTNPAAGFSPAYAPPADGHYVTASPTRPFSPTELEASQQQQQQQRLPSVLEAAIKAEPKVEVERLPSPSNSLDDGTPQARLYLANTSRQNLETIVEAIRHLEGDHLFNDEQDAPLALTNKPTSSGPSGSSAASSKQRLLHAEVNSFLQFQQQQSSPAPAAPTQPTTQPQSRTQQRPGVIVVKHS